MWDGIANSSFTPLLDNCLGKLHCKGCFVLPDGGGGACVVGAGGLGPCVWVAGVGPCVGGGGVGASVVGTGGGSEI